MDQHLVFAISREYGSGGREIGERLASELGIAYYDKLLLKRIAEESGLSGDVVEDFDEKPMRPLLLNPNSFFCGTDIEHPVASRIYKTEVDILRSIANEGPCVIVGRCADYVLEGHPGLVSLFVSAPMDQPSQDPALCVGLAAPSSGRGRLISSRRSDTRIRTFLQF